MIQEKYPIEIFAEHMAGIRGYIQAASESPNIISAEALNIVQKTYDKIVQYAYIHDMDLRDKKYIVRCQFTADEFSLFLRLIGWNVLVTDNVDWKQFFEKKNEKYQQKRIEKLLQVRKKYEEYLSGDVVDSKNRKTKALFYELTGCTPDLLKKALEMDELTIPH